MGTLWDKLNSLLSSIDDIQAAINEKKVEVDSTVPLSKYGEKIRSIETGGIWADYITLEGFPSYTEKDLLVGTIEDVTDNIILGTQQGIKSRDYITLEGFPSYDSNNLLAGDISDVTDTIEIITNNYVGDVL